MALILGHRGARLRAPQNTIPAFEAAIEHGADGVEFDVQMTADGVLVIHHDLWVDADSNGTGRLSSMTFDKLRSLDFGSWFKPEFEGTQIPTLEETLDCVKDMKYINVELKRPLEHQREELAEKAVDAVRNAGLLDKVIFSSFDYRTIDALKDIDLDLPCGLLYDPLPAECYDRRVLRGQFLRVLDEHRADALHPHYSLTKMPPNYTKLCHNAGVKVNVWGIKEHQGRVLAEYKRSDVDVIITDII